MKKALHIMEIVITVISIIFLIWFGISYIEIISKNLGENPVYSNYNLFIMLLGGR